MPVLGYWSIRAFAEPIRTLLHHVGADFEEKAYHFGPPPNIDRSEWFDVKFKLGLDVPNLPYYIDDKVKLTESSAIIRYLGRKHGLAGSSEEEVMRIDVAESVISEQTWAFIRYCYSPTHESDKSAYEADLNAKVQKCAAIIGDRPYTAGEAISYADFLLLEMLDRHLACSPSCLDAFPTLQAFQKRMLDLPGVKAWRDSSGFQKIKTRLLGRAAKFGQGEESY